MDRQSLENLLRDQIPLAKAMDVRIVRVDDRGVELRSDLEPNHNHLGTAFGGSLSALMILSAYCQLFHLMEGKGHVLLKSSSMEFLIPVEEELHAVCLPPLADPRAKFISAYQKKGKARLELESEIRLRDGTVACRMRGEFVGRFT